MAQIIKHHIKYKEIHGIDAINDKWLSIKNKPVAHCHIKKEEDKSHD